MIDITIFLFELRVSAAKRRLTQYHDLATVCRRQTYKVLASVLHNYGAVAAAPTVPEARKSALWLEPAIMTGFLTTPRARRERTRAPMYTLSIATAETGQTAQQK